VRTTLTLDDDVAAKLESEARRTGLSFKETVNTILRIGLDAKRGRGPRQPFKVTPFSMGEPLIGLDNIGEALDLLDRVEREERERQPRERDRDDSR
jgi:hypothetical protein